jgi:hypothetical protein
MITYPVRVSRIIFRLRAGGPEGDGREQKGFKFMKSFSASLLILAGLVAPAAAAPREPGPSVGQHHSHKSRPAHRTARSRRPADIDAFVRALRAHGLTVVAEGEVSQPFFSPRGRALAVGGENVQVFGYSSGRAAESEAKKVNPEGTGVGTSTAMWAGPPHFYKKGRLLVLYVGENEGVMKALTAVLGPQFAGK